MNPLRIAAFGAAACLIHPALAKIKVNPQTRQLVDESGRSIIFHGVNVVYKQDPYIPSQGSFDPENSLNDEDIQNLKNWGMNFVRLGVMWEAVERTPGVYDTEYIAKIDALITKLGEAGLYTLVDMHQDVFARIMCGEGFPDFYAREAIGQRPACVNWYLDQLLKPVYDKFNFCIDMEDYGYTKDENGDFLVSDCQKKFFADYYTSPQSVQAFKALYQNKNGLQDKFVDYWNFTSAQLSKNEYVVGLDPLNEPGPGNPFQDPRLVVPGAMDRQQLAPMYERLFATYQNNDPESVMWFEPTQFPDVIGALGGIVVPVGFDVPPGGQIGSDKHVLNDHTYCCSMGATVCAGGEPSTTMAAQCHFFHQRKLEQRSIDAKNLGLPFFISEFGACLTEGPCTQEIQQVTDIADQKLVGWAYWEFKTYQDLTTSAGDGAEGFYNPDGTLQTYKVKALARSYLMTTQGLPTSFDFNTNTGEFKAEFTIDTAVDAPTVMYLNKEFYYQHGYNVSLRIDSVKLDASQVAIDASDVQFYTFQVTDTTLNGKTLSVKVLPL